jgi:hypothetical protein
VEINYTNFDGDWNEPCEYCGKPNVDHQVSVGAHDGITYVHHQPCDEQLRHLKKCAVPRGFLPRLLQRMQTRRAARPQKAVMQKQSRIA